jgi:hypothetical protein
VSQSCTRATFTLLHLLAVRHAQTLKVKQVKLNRKIRPREKRRIFRIAKSHQRLNLPTLRRELQR